jgi:predicted porin
MIVRGAFGKLNAAFSTTNSKGAYTSTSATLTNADTTMYAAGYDLGVAKLMLMTTDSKSSQQGAQFYAYKGTQLGVQAPIGANVNSFATYGTGKSDTTSGTRGYDQKASQLGASYNLSKRTNAYAAMGNEVAKLVSTGKEVTIKQTIIGLRHSF